MIKTPRILFRQFATTSPVSNYHQIMNTMNKFLWSMDRGDQDEFAGLFTQDGKIEVTKTKAIYDSPEKLKKLCSDRFAQFSPAIHLESNFVIDIDPQNPNKATNKSYWYGLLGGDVISTGFHYDELVLQDGRWLFKLRVTEHIWTKNGGFEKKH